MTMSNPYIKPGVYLRKSHSEEEFEVYPQNSNAQDSRGRVVKSYTTTTPLVKFVGIITPASQKELERYNMQMHPITHLITHIGSPVAKATDMLKSGSNKYYVTGVEDTVKEWWTVYFVERRETDNDH